MTSTCDDVITMGSNRIDFDIMSREPCQPPESVKWNHQENLMFHFNGSGTVQVGTLSTPKSKTLMIDIQSPISSHKRVG